MELLRKVVHRLVRIVIAPHTVWRPGTAARHRISSLEHILGISPNSPTRPRSTGCGVHRGGRCRCCVASYQHCPRRRARRRRHCEGMVCKQAYFLDTETRPRPESSRPDPRRLRRLGPDLLSHLRATTRQPALRRGPPHVARHGPQKRTSATPADGPSRHRPESGRRPSRRHPGLPDPGDRPRGRSPHTAHSRGRIGPGKTSGVTRDGSGPRTVPGVGKPVSTST